MTTTDPAHEAPAPDRGDGPRRWTDRLVVHLALLALVLVGVALATAPHGTLVADDGSYQLQLRALDDGAWEWVSGTEQLDPDGTHYPTANADQTPDGWAPFAKHPAWPWLANAVAPVTGVDHAYGVLGAIGILVMAASAWLVVAERDRRWSPWAFWLAGTAPVAITSAVPWAHAAGTGAAGLAVLGAVRLVRRPATVSTVALLVGGLVAAGLLRTEGLLLAGAIAVALVLGGRQAGRSWLWSLSAGGAAAALGLAVVWAESQWIHAITGGASSALRARDGGGVVASNLVEARWSGAVRSLIDSGRPAMTALLAVAVVASAVTAALAATGRPKMATAWQGAAGVTVLLLVLRVLDVTNYPVSGLLAAWPIGLAGLAAGTAAAWSRARVEVTVAAVYGAAIVATQYADGGSGSWGGRFFALGTVPLVAVAVIGIERLIEVAPTPATADDGSGPLLTMRRFLVAVLVVPALLGVAVVHQVYATNEALYDWIDAQVGELGITPAVELPRMMWHQDVPWLVVDDDDGGKDLAELLGALSETGPDRVTVVLLDRDRREVDRAIAASEEWSEASRTHRDGLTAIVLQR